MLSSGDNRRKQVPSVLSGYFPPSLNPVPGAVIKEGEEERRQVRVDTVTESAFSVP